MTKRQVIPMGEKYAKNARTLDMYERLREGKSIRKCEEAQRFGVDERSIQRDIDDIRAFLDERQMQGDGRQVIYDRAKKGFVMEGQEASTMSNSEILAVAKILLESRAFSGREMTDVLQKNGRWMCAAAEYESSFRTYFQ